MKKYSLIGFWVLLFLSSCGNQPLSSQSDSISDTIPIVYRHQEFGQAVDSLMYGALLGNECLKASAYVIEAKTGRIVARSVLVSKGNFVETGIDIYRDIIKRGLSQYATTGYFKKVTFKGAHDNVPVYCGTKVLKEDAARMESCCFFPEEFPKYEIFVALEKKGLPADAEKICGPVIDDIIGEIVSRGMLGLMIKKEEVMDSDTGILPYFRSLCKKNGAEIWTHDDDGNDSLNVWDAVTLLHLYAEKELDTYPAKELNEALCNMALEQVYRESHGGDEYKGDNPGEKFLFRLIEQAAYYAPDISCICDSSMNNEDSGLLVFRDWSGMDTLYSFSISRNNKGRYKVKRIK